MSDREQEILSAAAKIFREKGYHRATIEDVAKEVGMLKGSLYYHIKNKNELLFKIGIAPLEATTKKLREIAGEDISPSQKLKKAVAERLKAFDNFFPEISVFFQEKFEELPESEREILRDGQLEDENLWIKILEEGIEKGEFRKGMDVKIVVKGITGMCHWMYKWYRQDGRLSSEKIAEIFVDFVFNGIANK
ncbi:MAG: TetR/AcrR family transcriptional regulator [Candidatus Schekmanbacteria bacterium]|nr:TetR/AcrR family transcriptional regulator [Candidatus Schekmanbacteria bacterium]